MGHAIIRIPPRSLKGKPEYTPRRNKAGVETAVVGRDRVVKRVPVNPNNCGAGGDGHHPGAEHYIPHLHRNFLCSQPGGRTRNIAGHRRDQHTGQDKHQPAGQYRHSPLRVTNGAAGRIYRRAQARDLTAGGRFVRLGVTASARINPIGPPGRIYGGNHSPAQKEVRLNAVAINHFGALGPEKSDGGGNECPSFSDDS